MTITLTVEQIEALKSLASTRQNQSLEQIANTVIERGLYDLAYRTKRNKEQYQQFKQFRASMK